MEAIRRAIWFVEAHFNGPVELDQVAKVSGLSRFHLSRRFPFVTGHTLSGYIRARRVSEGARRLADGESVLSTALAVGYASHEGFSRAFRAVFGTTPDAVRAARSTAALSLTEPFVMTEHAKILPAPTFVDLGPLHLVGIRASYDFQSRHAIPVLWQSFVPHIGHIPDAAGPEGYGACLSQDGRDPEEGFDYMAASAVTSRDEVPEGLVAISLPARRYAVFAHNDHISTIGATCGAIFAEAIPTLNLVPDDDRLILLERYGKGFDPLAGRGDISVMIPLKP